jgi:hypothetical protein
MSTGRANSTYVRYSFTFDNLGVHFDARVDWVRARRTDPSGALVPYFKVRCRSPQRKVFLGSDLSKASNSRIRLSQGIMLRVMTRRCLTHLGCGVPMVIIGIRQEGTGGRFVQTLSRPIG